MRLGLGVLGLRPADFWAMTPREFDSALHGRLGPTDHAASPTSADLSALMQAFPDQQTSVVSGE